MFDTASYNITAGRFVPHHDHADFVGFDWPDAELKMQVRDRPNGGQIRIDLGKVTTAAAEGVRVDQVFSVDGMDVTRIAWRINELTMDSLPLATTPDEDVVLYYDLHITPPLEAKFVALAGTFTVLAGVTD